MTITANGVIGLGIAGAQQALDSVAFRVQRKIAGLVQGVVLQEQHEDALEITEHPVQQGASIADHAFKRPATLSMHVAWSASPSTQGLLAGLKSGQLAGLKAIKALAMKEPAPGASYLSGVYDKLRELQESREPFDIITGKRIYSNMLLQSLAVTTDPQSEFVLMVRATFRQVIIVSTQVVTAPPAQQAQPAVTGATQEKGTQALQPTTGVTVP